MGNLVELKGNDLLIRSLSSLPEVFVWLVGEGPDRGRLESLARQAGVAERVRFVGQVAQSELPRYYSAADALVLASSREGWPNVLLEAIACGTPVVASRVGGTPEIVGSCSSRARRRPWPWPYVSCCRTSRQERRHVVTRKPSAGRRPRKVSWRCSRPSVSAIVLTTASRWAVPEAGADVQPGRFLRTSMSRRACSSFEYVRITVSRARSPISRRRLGSRRASRHVSQSAGVRGRNPFRP